VRYRSVTDATEATAVSLRDETQSPPFVFAIAACSAKLQ
jgi:hypothetical protein